MQFIQFRRRMNEADAVLLWEAESPGKNDEQFPEEESAQSLFLKEASPYGCQSKSQFASCRR